MFETGFLLACKAIILNILLPIIPGILLLWISFGKKFEGILLYLIGWFMGVGIVAFGLFNMQFLHFGTGVGEYFGLLLLLLLGLVIKIRITKDNLTNYIVTLKIKNNLDQFKTSYFELSKIEKIFTIIIGVLGLRFIVITGIRGTQLPTYGDDSFANRNKPAYNIYQDGGIKLFGDKSEILGRGRLGYPIQIATYKANISEFFGSFSDIYINLRQRLSLLFMFIFIFTTTFSKTKNLFYSALPIGLIISLPLVFFHANEGYMEIGSAAYTILSIRSILQFLQKKDYSYIALTIGLGSILSYIKNDGFVVYLPAIIISLGVILLQEKKLLEIIKGFLKDKKNLLLSGIYFVFFFLPFLIIKQYYHLGFNQASGVESGVGVSSSIHREIFGVFNPIFTQIDNYNTILIILAIITMIYIGKRKSISNEDKIILYTPIIIFTILLLVFLFTDNYRFALDQTTINRVFTVVFMILLSFSGYIASRGND